ncbi:hypothetical protein [Kineococcus indalonis]|uniref:hypothetical protein n=1 Tax=Kineococcus indalonis TaxID=2696566 RepID=UPI001411D94E|nr:hypothetical protein [Kineococcus indalonis]
MPPASADADAEDAAEDAAEDRAPGRSSQSTLTGGREVEGFHCTPRALTVSTP